MTTAEAIKHLSKELKDDPDYWRSWKANIAIQFQDEFHRDYKEKGIHEISNNAAQRFLELLTYEHDPLSEVPNA